MASADTVNTTYDAVNGVDMILSDIAAILRRVAENTDGRQLKKLLKDMEGEKGAYLTSVDDAMYGNVIKLMEEKDIPYFAYDVLGSTKKYILVAGKREPEVWAIANKSRIQFGLEIDTKQEMDDALRLTELVPQEKEFSNLSAEVAERMLEKALKHHVTAVKEKREDGTYVVYCAEKDKEKLNRFLFSAVWDLTGKSGEIEQRRLSYMLQEKTEIENALKRVQDGMEEAYLFSATNPGCYMHIHPEGYEYVKHGIVSGQMRMEQNPEDYAEVLKFQIRRLDNAVYMPASEVLSKGGPDAQLLQQELTDALYRRHMTKEDGYIIQAEKELRNWIENKYGISTDETLQVAKKGMTSLNLHEFQMEFAKICKRDTPQREAYYQRVINHGEYFGEHILQCSKMLENIQSQTITLQRELSQTIAVTEAVTKRENELEMTKSDSMETTIKSTVREG